MNRVKCQSNENLTNPRQSNFELFRIITMLFIIAHHYVVNSGLMAIDGPIRLNQFCLKSIVYLLVGAWGKIGINCFVFITGYFMCKSKITVRKFLKLLFEIYFYKIVIWGFFLFAGYETINIKSIVTLLLPFTSLDKNFTGCFIVFYLCIPFLNILIQNMTRKQHILLIVFSLTIFSLFGFIFTISFSYVIWFCVLYFISSFVQLYDIQLFNNCKFWLIASFISVIISCLSIILLTEIGSKYNKFAPYYCVSESNQILAVVTAFSLFMFFKNINLGYSKVINTIASTCFGVLLIHANSDSMRKWLWNDFLQNINAYYSNNYYIHITLSIICIFLACSFIDLFRIKFLERPLFKFIDKIENKSV